ncbi:hypothetical protein HanPSC8_Chr05g0226091 [Helianthus annuus]|nr:hypothetical protein HanPSC8_Chr05g0226091 [Helianthus annuus]
MSGFVSRSTQWSPTQSLETLMFFLCSSRTNFSPVVDKKRARRVKKQYYGDHIKSELLKCLFFHIWFQKV